MGDAVVSMRRETAPDAMVISLTGKIEETRVANGTHYSTVKVPGADEYSSPMPFELRSENSLGRVGEVVSVKARLTGFYKKSYVIEDTHPRTGEVTKRTVRPIVNALDVVN